MNIRTLLTDLAKTRKVFHSEADFQHALAWHIHKDMRDSQIRLEVNTMPVEHPKMYVDIWLPKEKIAIELKYRTRRVEPEPNGEPFALLEQGAQNQGRYDFLQDIQRLELMRSIPGFCEAGYAVLLTNDWLYWECPGPESRDTMDSAFRIHEGRKICGKLKWSKQPSPGTTRGRDKSIQLKGSYRLRWQDYSCIPEKSPGKGKPRGKFRYLAVSVC